MKIADEVLMAYADGELDAAARAEVEAAMAADPTVRQAVERHRALAGRVKSAYAGVLDEPVPARLAGLATPGPVSAGGRPDARVRFALPQWAAMAACLVLGLMAGVLATRGPGAPFEDTTAGLIARGALEQALTAQVAGDAADGAARVGISFRDRSGAYCRTFRVEERAPLAGLACRSGEAWRVQVLAATAAQDGELRPAAAMPPGVMQAVDAMIDGEPLDAAAEAAARDAGWPAAGGETGVGGER